MTRTSLALWPLIALLTATTILAQSPLQSSGDPGSGLNNTLNQRLQAGAESARWLWGTLRVQPSFGLRDVRLVDDVEIDSDDAIAGQDNSSDVTVGIFGGLHFYQLLGDNSSAGFFVRPQYDRWLDFDERSRLNLNFGAALAIETNRFFLDLEGVRSEGQAIVTNEAEQFINRRTDRIGARVGVPVYRSFALTATFQRTEAENLLDESPSNSIPNFGLLDETVDSAAIGVQVEPGRVTRLFLGFRRSEADAANSLRRFEAEGPTALVEIDAGVLSLRALVDQLEYEASGPGSSFEPIDTTTGRVDLALDGQGPHSLLFTVRRSLDASVRSAFTDFEATSSQLRWAFRATDRIQTRVGYRVIDRDYRDTSGRTDEQEGWLAGVSYSFEKLRLAVQYEQSQIDSSVDQFDRDTQRLGLSISFALPGLTWPAQ